MPPFGACETQNRGTTCFVNAAVQVSCEVNTPRVRTNKLTLLLSPCLFLVPVFSTLQAVFTLARLLLRATWVSILHFRLIVAGCVRNEYFPNCLHRYKAGEVPQAEDSVDMNREIAFLIHKILSADSSTAIRPQRLLENLPQISHQFQTRRQEDAHEFFSQLLDKMERDAASKKLPKCELFNGSLVSRVVCSQCHLKSDTIDPFSTLSVGIHRCTELSECLSCFFSTETLSGDNAFECSSCSTHVDAEKQTYFKSLPDILTIQLKRFHHGDFIKDNHLVAFPETLNLFERLLPERRMTDNNTSSADTTETLTESQCWYDLTGILVHVGYTILSGHYYAFVRLVKEDGTVEFRKMDDQTVDTVGRNVAMCAEAYMLLYERRTSE